MKCCIGKGSGFLISVFETAQPDRFDSSKNSGVVKVKMYGSVPDERLSCKILVLCSTFNLDWGFFYFPVAKATLNNIGVMILFVKLGSVLSL